MAEPMVLFADANTQVAPVCPGGTTQTVGTSGIPLESPVCPARAMQAEERQGLALRALAGTFTITQLAQDAGVSRKFVYQQASLAQQALDEAFIPQTPDERVLAYLPVTKTWLRQVTLSLVLACHSSYRGVIDFFGDCLDQSISLGTIHNIVSAAAARAHVYNSQQSLANEIGRAHV